MDDLYTPEDLAKILKISLRTLYRWHARRIGPSRTKCGNFIGYRKQAVADWIKSNETDPVSGGK